MSAAETIFMKIRRMPFEDILAQANETSFSLYLTGGAFPERFDFDEAAGLTLKAIEAHSKAGYLEPAQMMAALGRAFEMSLSEPVAPGEGLVAAARTIHLGAEFMVDRVRGSETVYFEIIKNYPASWFFALGWKILYDEVIMTAAQALESAVAAELERGPKRSELLFFQRAFSNAVQKGMPWLAGGFDKLEPVFGRDAADRFFGFTRELPRLEGERGAIASMNEVQEALIFSAGFER